MQQIDDTRASGHRYCIAPMMDWTDRHDRYFLRLISKHTRLYTEMITTQALRFGDIPHLLDFSAQEHPIALQLGGHEPAEMAHCAKLAEEWGYDEVNINVGCPSDRVQKGRFGACLMAEAELVAECVAAMKAACKLPITVKTRIGIDTQDSEDFLFNFVKKLVAADLDLLIVHARKAWLKGLSPKENREKPPLNYARVQAVKHHWPELPIIINGGINTLDQAQALIDAGLDGVMVGRAAYQTPYILAEVDHRFFQTDPTNTSSEPPSRLAVIQALHPYLEAWVESGFPLKRITRHISGLFHGCPGARQWRRHLSESTDLTPNSVLAAAEAAQAALERSVLRATAAEAP